MNMETVFLKYFFKKNKISSWGAQGQGKVGLVMEGEYLKAGKQSLEIEPEGKSWREVT